MPYRLNPSDKTEVQVKKGSGWEKFRKHKTVNNAKAHLTALNMEKRDADKAP